MRTEARILTMAELAREADVDPEEVDELVAAGILRPDDGRYTALDVPRVRLAHALREGGITPDDLRRAIQSRQLPIDRVAEMSAPPSRSDHTFGELMASLGERGDQLPSVYAAFGLAVPPIEAAIPVDEEQLLRRFFEVWAMVDDSPEVATRGPADAAVVDARSDVGQSRLRHRHARSAIADAARLSATHSSFVSAGSRPQQSRALLPTR